MKKIFIMLTFLGSITLFGAAGSEISRKLTEQLETELKAHMIALKSLKTPRAVTSEDKEWLKRYTTKYTSALASEKRDRFYANLKKASDAGKLKPLNKSMYETILALKEHIETFKPQ